MNDQANSSAVCRCCEHPLRVTFIDLGMSPLCETYPSAEDLDRMEPYYPLHCYVCEQCFLVQLREYEDPSRIFTEYGYFSSYSDTWLQHASRYCETMTKRFSLTRDSFIVEVGSNDGYLLQYFVARQFRVLGIEPARNVAAAALRKGIPTVSRFFNTALATDLARGGRRADLIVANNVLAQMPDLNDFVLGLKILLAPAGVITIEFPHLLRTMENNQFDQIYHEHFSYFSFFSARRILGKHKLRVFDVEELPTHGGSLRLYVCHEEDLSKPELPSVQALHDLEERAGLTNLCTYQTFARHARETKWKLVQFLVSERQRGKSIAGYGAPGKGTTLLHYCGIGRDLVEYTVDRSEYKQGRFMPGTHIPIYHPDKIRETKPDYILILPWNLKDEIMNQMSDVRQWGGRFIVPIPEVVSY